MMFVLFIFVIISCLAFLAEKILAHIDFGIPEIDLCAYVMKKKKKQSTLRFMALYPHPDDETMMSGGTIARFAHCPDVEWTIVSVTKGEHGDELRKDLTPKELARVRAGELRQACGNLGIKNVVIGPFEDGTLKKQKMKLKQYIASLYRSYKPDLVITFEKNGIYGHPDHVALSQAAYALSKQKSKQTPLVLFSTLPQSILQGISLPTHMADDPDSVHQSIPEYRISFFRFGWKKYKAALSHRSQNLNSRGKNPLWAYTIFHPVEYITEKY